MSDQNNDLKSTLLSNEPMPEAVPVKATAIGQKEEVAVNPIPAASSLVVSKDPIDPVLQTTIEEFEVIFDKAVATTKTSKESQEFPTPVRLTARLTDPSDANLYDILKGIFAAYLEKIDYTGLTKRIQQVEIDMDVNEAAIMLRASKEELNPYWYRLSQAETDIDGANAKIDLKASQLELSINGLDYRLSKANIAIDGANAQIALKASRKEVDDTIERVSAAEIAINGLTASIDLKASKSSLEGAVQRVSAAEVAISGANAEIALRATKTEVSNVTNRVSAAEIAINGANADIALRATKTETDAISARVTTAEASITVNSNSIALKVNKTDFDPLATRVTTAETAITQNTNDIALRATKVDTDALAGRITTAEASIVTNANSIALKASQTDLNSLTNRVTTAEASIVTNANSIALKVAKTEFDPVVGRITTAESQITQYAGKIALMVADDNTIKAGVIVDAINGGTVKIAANKVQIDGTTTFAPGYNPSETVRYLYMQENDPSLSWDAAYKEKMLNARWTKTSTTEDSVEYIYQNVAGSYVWVENSTVIDGGRIKTGLLEAQYIDVDNLFAKELIATNMYVKNGRIGDFLINNNLTGSGYTNGTLNGNQIVLDPSNNEIVLSKNGVKRVRITNNELTPLALLQVDGGTIACTNGTSVAWSTTNGIIASKNLLGIGGDGISKTMYVGINRPNPVLASTVDGIVKFNLQPGMYSLDMPFSLGVLHGKGFDVNSDKTDGRYNRITGVNDAYVTVKLMTATGLVSMQSFYVELKLDTVDTGNDTFFGRMARFNFTVSSAADYWMEVTYTIKGGSTRPIRYQSYNHATTFRHSYWSEQYGMAVHYDMRIDPGMTVDGSIGITELSNSGFQSVWTPTRYLRIDGNTANNIFIESQGRWLHNGIEIKFDKNTITGYIDQGVFATKSFVTQGYYNTAQSDGRYLGISATAADSAKLGGRAAADYYHVANANLDTVNWSANLLSANNINVSAYTRSSRKGAPSYVGNWEGAGWWGIGEYNANTVRFEGVDNNMAFNGNGVNLRISGNLTANGGNQVWDASNTPNRFYEGDALVSNVDFATIVGNRSHFNEVGNGSGNTNIPDSYGTLVSFGGYYFGGKLHFPPSVDGYAGLKWRPKHENYSASWHTIYDTHNLNRSDTDFNARTIYTNNAGGAGNIGIRNHGIFYQDNGAGYPWLFGKGVKDQTSRFDFVYNSLTALSLYESGIIGNNYSGSGFTSTGWGITTDGDANFRNHNVRGKLTTYEFVQNKISIANGNMIVSDNCKTIAVGSGSWWDCYYDKNEGCPFVVGDYVRSKTKGEDKFGKVVSINTDLGIFFIDKAGYNGNAPVAGDLFVRWNSTDAARKGLLYLCSSDAGSPNYQVIYDGAVKAQFGNLEGRSWLGSTLPANTWGLWAENAYLSGAVNATSGKIANTTIEQNRLINIGTGYGSRTMNAAISTAEVGSGPWWTSSNHTSRGFNFNFDTVGRAWSMVMGQMWNKGSVGDTNTTQATSNNYGFQIIAHDSFEHLAIGADYNDGTGKAFGRLANGNISWDAAGNVTFSDSVKLQWQSGGRNYVRNSKVNETSNSYGFGYRSVDLIGGEIYTLSANGRCNNVSSGKRLVVYLYKPDWSWATTVDITATSDTTSKRTFTAPSTGTYSITSYYYDSSSPREGTVTLNWYKVEKGYNATDWTPAPEDVDSKLTRIGPDGIYTGKIKAENIDGDILSGKTINAINTSERTILQLHGRDGTLTGFDDAGVIQSQLSRGSLTFYDSLGVPAVFLRNSDISLSECQNSGSISVAAVNSIPVGTGVSVSNGFSISKVGAYKGNIPMSISASGSIIVDDSNGIIDYTTVTCTVRVYASVDLEWLNPSTGLYEPYLNGVAYMSAYGNSASTFASCSKTGNANLSFTASKTGTFRLKFSHTRNCYGNAWNSQTNDRADVVVSALDSTVNNTGAMIGTKISNGTYIGNNGFICYNGTGYESFVVFDKSIYNKQFMVQANSEISSLNKEVKLSVDGSGVNVIISGTTKLRVTDSGRIFIYGAPAVSTNVDGTGTNRYRLYLDEYNQLCRSPNNGW